jgi:hypothetical protein
MGWPATLGFNLASSLWIQWRVLDLFQLKPLKLGIEQGTFVETLAVQTAFQRWKMLNSTPASCSMTFTPMVALNFVFISHATVPIGVLRWDATEMPLRHGSVDIVLTDMPFGRRHGSYHENRRLVPQFMKELWRVLVPETGRAYVLTTARRIMAKALNAQMREGNWQLQSERYVRILPTSQACSHSQISCRFCRWMSADLRLQCMN